MKNSGNKQILMCGRNSQTIHSERSEESSVPTLAKFDDMSGSFGKPQDERKAAFTLAEVLITLGIIGVVAALTIPMFMENVTERTNSERQANIAQKITQATDKMRALDKLGHYDSTDEFVDELQKHLKIAKRCKADELENCWPVKKVTANDGTEFEIKDAKTSKNLQLGDNWGKSDNVGLVLADGASIILSWNTNSDGLSLNEKLVGESKSLPIGKNKFKDYAYTTNSTNSIDFIMDVNGKGRPNSETIDEKKHDIRSFRIAKLGKGCSGVEKDGTCYISLGKMPGSESVTKICPTVQDSDYHEDPQLFDLFNSMTDDENKANPSRDVIYLCPSFGSNNNEVYILICVDGQYYDLDDSRN